MKAHKVNHSNRFTFINDSKHVFLWVRYLKLKSVQLHFYLFFILGCDFSVGGGVHFGGMTEAEFNHSMAVTPCSEEKQDTWRRNRQNRTVHS